MSPAEVVKLQERLALLQSENRRIPKLEEAKKKLELEVTYWKEYVTKRSGKDHNHGDNGGGSSSMIIDLQSELDQVQQKLAISQSKTTAQHKEIVDLKSWSQEASTMLAVHKATAETLRKELEQAERHSTKEPTSAGHAMGGESAHTERSSSSGVKFNAVKGKLQQIERELHQKSKELEKANESRAKVAKYTRSLLQELEVKLNETQKRALEWEEKALIEQKNVRMEQSLRLSIEKELEDFKLQNSSQQPEMEVSVFGKKTFPERMDMDLLLQEKDAQLRFSEDLIKQLQISLKKVANQHQSSDQLQARLSEATHKVTENQLKIHTLTRQVEELKPLERKYVTKVEECQGYQSQVADLNKTIFDLKIKADSLEKELEMQNIKEVVLKEQLIAYEYDSSCESDEEGFMGLEKQKLLKEELDKRIHEQAELKKEELHGKGDTQLLMAKLECAEKEAYLKSRLLLDAQNELCASSVALLALKRDLADANDVVSVQNESLAEKSEECEAKCKEVSMLKAKVADVMRHQHNTHKDITDGPDPSSDPVHDQTDAGSSDGVAKSGNIAELLASVIKSDQQVIELSEALERESKLRIQIEVSLMHIERKMSDVTAQLEQANRSLNAKVEELDKERHNVIHLVDVTGVYVKELEDALLQSRSKLQALDSAANGGSTACEGAVVTPSPIATCDTAEEEGDGSYVKRIAMLESQVSTLSSMYDSRSQDASPCGDGSSVVEKIESSMDRPCILCNDRADLLDRVQELELEMQDTRQSFDERIHELQNEHKSEKAKLEQKILSTEQLSYGEKSTYAEKEMLKRMNDKMQDLEEELQNITVKHEHDMNIERESHQKEMEETIRDMLLIKGSLDSSGLSQCDDGTDGRLSSRRSSVSVEDAAEQKTDYEKRIAQLKVAHTREMALCQKDMESVLESLGHGNPGNVIVSLTTENRILRNELQLLKDEADSERSTLQLAVERAECASYTALTRNEEMAAKVFEMQNELEEVDRREKGSTAIPLEDFTHLTTHVIELEEDLAAANSKIRALTEEQNQDHNVVVAALTEELMSAKHTLDQSEEHHRQEVDRLTCANRDNVNTAKMQNEHMTTDTPRWKADLGDDQFEDHAVEATLNSTPFADHKAWIEQLLQRKQTYFDGQITQIRTEYEEKLKACMKENMRRVSQSERKSETQRVKEANRRISDLETQIVTTALQHEKELMDYRLKIEKLRSLNTGDDGVGQLIMDNDDHATANLGAADDKGGQQQSDKEIQRLGEQITRYEQRVDYYKEKAQRENCAESHRVVELKEEIAELQSTMRGLQGASQKQYRRPKVEGAERVRHRHCSDGVQMEKKQALPLAKRWSSDLQGRQETIVSKIGALSDKRNQRLMVDIQKEEVGRSVASRKAIWEGIDRV